MVEAEHLRLTAAGVTLDAFMAGRLYPDATIAKRAWRRALKAEIPDAGATRMTYTDGAGRVVVYFALGRIAWELLAPLADGGEEWQVPDPIVRRMVNRRIEAAVSGEGTFITEGA